jgi:hypothetical protein
MDNPTVLVVAIFAAAAVLIVLFIALRDRISKFFVKRGDTEVGFEAFQKPAPGSASIEHAKATGSMKAAASTGGSATIKDAEAGGDMTATATLPPKADPPKKA